MVRETITLSVGTAGVKTSESIWKRYCIEHGIPPDGICDNILNYHSSNPSNEHLYKTFFEESHCGGSLIARNLMCDDSNLIDNLNQNEYRNIFSYGSYRNQTYKESCANIFARGHNTIGRDKIDNIDFYIRKMVDECDNIQGFIINHSIAGGMSGLTALILEHISTDYRRKQKLGVEIIPSSNGSVLDPYNMALSMSNLIEHTNVCIMFDNNALYNQCRNHLNIQKPNFDNLNELISKTIAGLTQTLRFSNCSQNCDLRSWETNFVPFPKLHFLTPSFAPILPKYDPVVLINGYVRDSHWNASYNDRCLIYNDIMRLLYKSYDIKCIENDAVSLTKNVLNLSNYLIEFPDFDLIEDKYMSCGINYRVANDNITSKSVSEMLPNEFINFVDWVPTNQIKWDVMSQKQICQDNSINNITSNLCHSSAAAVTNHSGFGNWVQKRILNKFNLLFDKRAFIHWYTSEGMEYEEFNEAREEMHWLCQDYMDVLSDEEEDDDDDDDDEDITYNRNDYILGSMSEQEMIRKAIQDSLK